MTILRSSSSERHPLQPQLPLRRPSTRFTARGYEDSGIMPGYSSILASYCARNGDGLHTGYPVASASAATSSRPIDSWTCYDNSGEGSHPEDYSMRQRARIIPLHVLVDGDEETGFEPETFEQTLSSTYDGVVSETSDHYQENTNDLDNSHQLQPSTLDFVRVSALDMRELTEYALKQFLGSNWIGISGSKRARSWPSSPDPSEVHISSVADSRQNLESDNNHDFDVEESSSSKIFACPFYRRNPEGHWHCLQQVGHLRDISSLIEHLWDDHIQPPYCPTCHATFSTSRSCDEHIKSRGCSLQTAPLYKGLTQEQMQQIAGVQELSEELHLSIAPTVQWFILWSIAFPDTEPTRGPYLTRGFESLICAVCDFWVQNGHNIVLEFSNGMDLSSNAVECNMKTLRHAILEQMIGQLIMSYTQGEHGQAQGCSQAANLLTSML